MKKGLIIGLAATAVAASVSSLVPVGVSAGPLQRGSNARAAADDAAAMVPGSQIATSVRAAGLDPNGEPELRGRYYVLRALDANGTEMRVLADAQVGDILSILPARRQVRAYQPPSYGGGARIIHVPLADDVVAERDDHADAAGDAGNGYEPPPQAAPPVRRVYPRPPVRQRSEAPRIKRHIVSSAPPQPPHPDKVLTPVYPTPDFGTKAAGAEKFDPPPQESEAAPPQRLE